jgi:hypothetical protein
MKAAIIFLLLIITPHFFQCSENKIVEKLTTITRDLISGIFVGIKGQTWNLPDTCLSQEFVNDVSGFVIHLKKFQTVYSSAYLNKLIVQDVFADCPADQIINLYFDIKESIKSGQIYLNTITHIKKIISLIMEIIKNPKVDSYDLGIFFGKLINFSVYGKSENKFILLSNSSLENKKEDEIAKGFVTALIKNILENVGVKENLQYLNNDLLIHNSSSVEIFDLLKKFKENKQSIYKWGFILEKLLEKYERNKETNILKKFFIYSLTSYEFTKDFIQNFNIENTNLDLIHYFIEIISNMLG